MHAKQSNPHKGKGKIQTYLSRSPPLLTQSCLASNHGRLLLLMYIHMSTVRLYVPGPAPKHPTSRAGRKYIDKIEIS